MIINNMRIATVVYALYGLTSINFLVMRVEDVQSSCSLSLLLVSSVTVQNGISHR